MVNTDGREGRGNWEMNKKGETIIKINYVRTKAIFNKMKIEIIYTSAIFWIEII